MHKSKKTFGNLLKNFTIKLKNLLMLMISWENISIATHSTVKVFLLFQEEIIKQISVF